MRDLGHPSILTEDVLGVPKPAGTGCRTETFFITFGGTRAHDNSGRDDKGRDLRLETKLAVLSLQFNTELSL